MTTKTGFLSVTRMIVARRSYYDSTYLGIPMFMRIRQATEKDRLDEYESLRKNLQNKLNDLATRSNETDRINLNDFRTFVYLSNTDEDLELLKNILKKNNWNSNDLNEFKKFNLDEQIMRLLYVLNKPNVGLELINDKTSEMLFDRNNSLLILMNKLAMDQQYDKLIEVFIKRLASYKKQQQINDQTGQSNLSSTKFNKQEIPNNHIYLLLEALYFINNADSLDLMKNIHEFIQKKNIQINNSCRSLAILLAVNQKDLKYANELFEIYSNFKTSNKTLYLNLKCILTAFENKFNESFECLNEIVNYRPGFVFPFTIKCMSINVNKAKSKNKTQLLEELNSLEKRIIDLGKINKKDLVEYLTSKTTSLNKSRKT